MILLIKLSGLYQNHTQGRLVLKIENLDKPEQNNLQNV